MIVMYAVLYSFILVGGVIIIHVRTTRRMNDLSEEIRQEKRTNERSNTLSVFPKLCNIVTSLRMIVFSLCNTLV